VDRNIGGGRVQPCANSSKMIVASRRQAPDPPHPRAHGLPAKPSAAARCSAIDRKDRTLVPRRPHAASFGRGRIPRGRRKGKLLLAEVKSMVVPCARLRRLRAPVRMQRNSYDGACCRRQALGSEGAPARHLVIGRVRWRFGRCAAAAFGTQ